MQSESKRFDWTLKPETISLLKRATLLLCAFYALALVLFGAAGKLLDYQTALVWSERLMAGVRAGFGVLCLGFLFMECK